MKFWYQILIIICLGNLSLLGDIPYKNELPLFHANKFQLEETSKNNYQATPILSSNSFDGTNSGIRSNSHLAKTITQESFFDQFFHANEYSFQSLQKAYFKTYSANYFHHAQKIKRYLRCRTLLI